MAKVDEIQEQELPHDAEEGEAVTADATDSSNSADVAGPDLQDSQLAQDNDTEQS